MASQAAKATFKPAYGKSVHGRGAMTQVLLDRYRCPDTLWDFDLAGRLSEDAGYFRVGNDLICYGRSTHGFRTADARSPLYSFPDPTPDGSKVLLPFDPAEIVDNLRLERYAAQFTCSGLNHRQRLVRNLYYLVRPLMPVAVRKHLQRARLKGWQNLGFPRWPVDTTVEDLHEQLLLWWMQAQGIERLPFVWFWPAGARSCAVMTHDVETGKGHAACSALMDMDDSFGIKSSFQLIPEGPYPLSPDNLQKFRDRGFEINMQDLNHDGHLFDSKAEFTRRAEKITRYGRLYGARGFRSAVLYRNQDWFQALELSYDMSVPNVAHLDPQRGGCCTVMPYFIGDTLEIPVTTTQDYALFHLLGDYSLDLWKSQAETILNRNGLISFVVHPDYLFGDRARNAYRQLLTFIRELGSEQAIWFALPRELDEWWRSRSQMRVVHSAGSWHIEGEGAERAVLAFAVIKDGRLEYQLDSRLRLVKEAIPWSSSQRSARQ